MNGQPSPADRFGNWVPKTEPIGESANDQAVGALTMFRFRTEYGASFELDKINTSNVAIADDLIAWLLNGGTCTVNTGDAGTRSYTTCSLKKGTTPTLRLTDRVNMEYTLTLELINQAGAQMVCFYPQ